MIVSFNDGTVRRLDLSSSFDVVKVVEHRVRVSPSVVQSIDFETTIVESVVDLHSDRPIFTFVDFSLDNRDEAVLQIGGSAQCSSDAPRCSCAVHFDSRTNRTFELRPASVSLTWSNLPPRLVVHNVNERTEATFELPSNVFESTCPAPPTGLDKLILLGKLAIAVGVLCCVAVATFVVFHYRRRFVSQPERV